MRATAAGFGHPAGVELLDAFVPQYFEMPAPDLELAHATRSRSTSSSGLYPAALANKALRDATRAWLAANTDAAPALRRLVTENLAGVERALAVQERDAQ